MAFTLTAVSLLARSHAAKPFEGPVLTLGKQGIYGTLDQCAKAIRAGGLEPKTLPPRFDTKTDVPAFQSGAASHFTNDNSVFQMICGMNPETLDVSDYEGADHIHDLNQALPDTLKGRFGTVIDGGTLEHVFDAAQTLRNLKAMLRPGGRIIHMNPMNNWAEHGYYQLSPTLFHDFYVTNGFSFTECLIIGVGRASLEGGYDKKAGVWRWNPARPSAQITSSELLTTFFEAEKMDEVPDRVPQQGEAATGVSSSQLGGIGGRGTRLNRLRAKVLETVPYAGIAVLVGKKILRRDISSKPWGLEYIGRF